MAQGRRASSGRDGVVKNAQAYLEIVIASRASASRYAEIVSKTTLSREVRGIEIHGTMTWSFETLSNH